MASSTSIHSKFHISCGVLLLSFSLLGLAPYQSCAQKKIRSWQNKEIEEVNIEKILVLGLIENVTQRDETEETLVLSAQKNGLKAEQGIYMFPPELGNPFEDMKRVRERLSEKGFDALMSIAFFKVSANRYVPPSQVYAPVSYYDRFGSYYNRSYMTVRTPGYLKADEKYFIECNLFSVASGQLIWSGRSYAFFTEALQSNLKKFNKELFKELKSLDLIP